MAELVSRGRVLGWGGVEVRLRNRTYLPMFSLWERKSTDQSHPGTQIKHPKQIWTSQTQPSLKDNASCVNTIYPEMYLWLNPGRASHLAHHISKRREKNHSIIWIGIKKKMFDKANLSFKYQFPLADKCSSEPPVLDPLRTEPTE